MSWEEIKIGARPDLEGVKISVRKGAGSRLQMIISISPEVLEALGWERGHRVRVFRGRDVDAGNIRLVRDTRGRALSAHKHNKVRARSCYCAFPPWREFGSDRRPSTRCAHWVADGALIVEIPKDWLPLRQPPRRRAATRVQPGSGEAAA